MSQKDLDVLELMRESLLKANKQLGFTKEQILKESAFEEQFDPEKHMPKFEVSKNWGTTGTVEANQIDAIIKNIIDVNQPDGLERYKQAIGRMNQIFGATEKKEGELETTAEEPNAKITEIISSLQIKNIIHAIINNKDPQTAGKLYEFLMARIAGGFTPGEANINIADFLDGEGKFISLKTLKSGSKSVIKGSKVNLATAVAKKGEVIFLVCLKDQEPDTFKLSSYSFAVNKDNYFNFILGDNQNVNLDAVLGEMNSLEKRLSEISKDVEIGRKERIGAKILRQLDLDGLRGKLEQYTKKRGNIKNFKIAQAQEQFDNAQEGSPEKAEAKQLLDAALQEYNDNEANITDLKDEIASREAKAKSGDKESAGENLNESLAQTQVISDIADNVQIAKDIFIMLNPTAEIKSDKDVRKYFSDKLKPLESFLKSDPKALKLFKNSVALYTKGREEWDPDTISKAIVRASGSKLLSLDNLKILDGVMDFIQTLSGIKLGIETETDPKILSDYEKLNDRAEQITSEEENRINSLFKQNEPIYNKIKQNLQISYRPFVETYTQFANVKIDKKNVSRTEPQVKAGEISIFDRLNTGLEKPLATKDVGGLKTQMSGKEVLEKVNDFWKKMEAFEGLTVKNLEEANSPDDIKKDLQFSVSIPKSKQVAQMTKGGKLDESYPTVFVTGKNLKTSSETTAKLFKDWAEPIYRGMHYLTNGVNRYFIEDDVAGLTLANNSASEVISSVTTIKEKGTKASELKENKQPQKVQSIKEYIKNSPLDDILEDLLK